MARLRPAPAAGGLDIADAQKAEERLLDEYIRAGRLDAAQTTAEIARLRSMDDSSPDFDPIRIRSSPGGIRGDSHNTVWVPRIRLP